MKNAINYYYNIDVEDIHQKNKNYKFNYNNEQYVFTLFEDDISNITNIYNIHIQLLQNGLYCHQIILNVNNEILTFIDGKYYILMKISINNKKIDIDDIVNFSRNYIVYRNDYTVKDWVELWSKKTDYIEYQVSQFGIKYQLISSSAAYYIGLSETAISYLNNNKVKSEVYSISHRRLKYNSTLFDLYNPINFIIDIPIRDICEYLKDMYFETEEDIINYIYKLNFDRQSAVLFFSRLLYPTYYFDAIESCIDNEAEEKSILKYVNKVNKFESILSNIMKYYKKIYNLEVIEWLIKT